MGPAGSTHTLKLDVRIVRGSLYSPAPQHWRNPEHRELFLSGLRLAAGEAILGRLHTFDSKIGPVWDSVTGLVAQIKKCEKAGATTATVVIAYVCIDTTTFLSLPAGRESQGRADFIAWVNAYLKGHPELLNETLNPKVIVLVGLNKILRNPAVSSWWNHEEGLKIDWENPTERKRFVGCAAPQYE